MELSFSQLKQKDVVSVTDGKNLGKVCDISLTFPDNNWLGITVTGCKGFKLTNKKELFIPVGEIVKIGQDAILVKTGEKNPTASPRKRIAVRLSVRPTRAVLRRLFTTGATMGSTSK